MEHQIMQEIAELLAKTGLEDVMPPNQEALTNHQTMETVLINLKSLNARYEKGEAVEQVQWLMHRYNIQIDELMERINA